METVRIEDLQEWRKDNPDVETVLVDHGVYGKSIYVFNYVNPQEIPQWAEHGAYDGFGNFHFIDMEGTYHKCLSERSHYNNFKHFK